MKIRLFFTVILIIILGIIQTTFPKTFEFGYAGIKPNFLLVFIILYAFFNGSYKGAIIGFTAGLIQDLSTGMIIGYYALIGLGIGLLVGWTNSKIYKENLIVASLIVFIGTVLYEFTVALLLGMKLFTGDNLFYALKFIIFPEAFYNCLISIVVYMVMRYISKRFKKAPIRDLYN